MSQTGSTRDPNYHSTSMIKGPCHVHYITITYNQSSERLCSRELKPSTVFNDRRHTMGTPEGRLESAINRLVDNMSQNRSGELFTNHSTSQAANEEQQQPGIVQENHDNRRLFQLDKNTEHPQDQPGPSDFKDEFRQLGLLT